MVSTFGIILTVLIIIALAASAASEIIAKFGANLGFVKNLSFLKSGKSVMYGYLETIETAYFIFPVLLILFIIEILLIIPVLISCFYLQPFYFGIIIALLFNSFLITGFIFLWKNGRLETLNSRFIITIIDSVRNKFIKA